GEENLAGLSCRMADSALGWGAFPEGRGTDFALERDEQLSDTRMRVAKHLYLLQGVANGRMVTPVIESADPGGAPPAHVLGELHRDLTIEDGGLGIAPHPGRAEPFGHHSIDRLQRDPRRR